MRKLSLFTLSSALLFAPSLALAAACGPSGAVTRVKNTSGGAFEYVIFKFHKPPTVPAYTVKAVTGPFTEDPSGNPVVIAGAKFTEVRFDGVFWMCSITENLNLPKTAIKGVKNIGQFEGVVTYIIGRRAASHYISNYSYDSGPGYRSIVIKFKK